jgi:hypothetical protein
MKTQTIPIRIFVTLLVLILVSSTYSQTPSPCYPNVTDALMGEITVTVSNLIENRGSSGLSRMPLIIAYAAADALGSKTQVRKLEAYQYVAETARTDKQIGASAKSAGSTSAIEKPGLVNLLGFAIEHGAIQQNVNDTTVTLSSSPYAFVALTKGDSPKTYQDYELLNRLGVSATFDLNNKDNVLSNVSRKQLTEWSAKLRLTGDRSTRSKVFQDFWTREIAPLIQTRLNLRQDIADAISRDKAIEPLYLRSSSRNIVTPLQAQITAYLNGRPTDTPDQKKTASDAITEMILCAVRTSVYEPIASGSLTLSPATEAGVAAGISSLSETQSQLATARQKIVQFLQTIGKQGTLSTFAYTNHRVEMGSDYSELKLLFERHVNPLDIILNAGVSLYNKPDPALNQDRIRDFDISFSLEGSARSPLRLKEEDLSKITYSFTFRYQRLMENENMATRTPDIANAQFRLEFPIAAGLSIPIAYTYASATEMGMKKENKFNIGLHLDIDKLYSLTRAAKQ